MSTAMFVESVTGVKWDKIGVSAGLSNDLFTGDKVVTQWRVSFEGMVSLIHWADKKPVVVLHDTEMTVSKARKLAEYLEAIAVFERSPQVKRGEFDKMVLEEKGATNG